jgi:hypothetical protein
MPAQENYVAFGFKASFGFSKFSGMDRYEEASIIPGSSFMTESPYTSGIFPAWDLGIVVQGMRDRLMIQGDLTVSYLNTKLNNAYVGDMGQMKRIRIFYNNISVNLGTKIPVNDNYRFVLGGGPYIGFDMSTWFSSRSNHYGINEGSYSLPEERVLDAEEADYKVFDFGGSVLAGIEYKNMQFALNYHHGLINVVKDEFPLRNRSCKLNFIYFF